MCVCVQWAEAAIIQGRGTATRCGGAARTAQSAEAARGDHVHKERGYCATCARHRAVVAAGAAAASPGRAPRMFIMMSRVCRSRRLSSGQGTSEPLRRG
mmetsp:Transcript_43242/g.122267  ORF Transcript_43242/g.122267 Transcript_43242/m.122267 type:complete len:99 (+) Transcript_43242:298-594(+)